MIAVDSSPTDWVGYPDKTVLHRYMKARKRRVGTGSAPNTYCGKRMTVQSEPGRENLEMRRKRLRFRAWHRGMREVDLLLGRFADAIVAELDEAELAGFEALLDVPDQTVLTWITGEASVPAEADSRLLRRLLAFHGTGSPATEA